MQQLADRAHEAAAKQSEREARRLLAPVPEGGMLASHARAPNPEKNLYTFTGAQAAANRRILCVYTTLCRIMLSNSTIHLHLLIKCLHFPQSDLTKLYPSYVASLLFATSISRH